VEEIGLPPAGQMPEPAAPTAVVSLPAYPAVATHADRSTGLVIFGIFQIIFGLLAALLIPLVALGAFASRFAAGGSMRPGQIIYTIVTYGFVAVALVTLGIGSIQARRWARALTVVTSWYWLIMGLLITVLMTAVLPVAMRAAMEVQRNAANAPPAEISAGVMAVIITLIICFMAFFLVAVPIGYLVFYSREDVALTCRDRDPVERWTDRTPLRVLGASMVFFVGALYLLLVGLTTPVFPFFGRYLTGVPGTLCFLVLAALDLYLAIGTFRLQLTAWWTAVITVPLRVVSMALTYAKADLIQAYSRTGMSQSQLNALSSNPVLRGHAALWWSLIAIVIFFFYLLSIKRYFKAPESHPPEIIPVQAG
jgi:hypothetical protein